MRTKEDLTEAESACLSIFENNPLEYAAQHGMSKAYILGEKLSEELNPKQWEPKGGGWFVSCDGLASNGNPSDECRLIGSESETKEGAQRIADLRIELGIINARIVEENQRTGFVADWNKKTQWKHSVVYSHKVSEWTWHTNNLIEYAGTEFCSAESAKKIVKELNEGKITGIKR